MIVVIDHELGHASVDRDILARDKPAVLAAQEQDDPRYIGGLADAPRRMLRMILSWETVFRRVDPSRRNAVHPHASGEAYGQCVCLRGYAALGSGVAFGIGLGHTGAGGGDVHDAGTGVEMWKQELCQQIRRGHANPLHVQKIFILAAGQYAAFVEAGIVDKIIRRTEMSDDFFHECPKRFFVGNIAVKKRSQGTLFSSMSITATFAPSLIKGLITLSGGNMQNE